MVLRSPIAAAEQQDMETGVSPNTPQEVASPWKWSFFPSEAGNGSGAAAHRSGGPVLGHVVSKTWAKDADLVDRPHRQQKVHAGEALHPLASSPCQFKCKSCCV